MPSLMAESTPSKFRAAATDGSTDATCATPSSEREQYIHTPVQKTGDRESEETRTNLGTSSVERKTAASSSSSIEFEVNPQKEKEEHNNAFANHNSRTPSRADRRPSSRRIAPVPSDPELVSSIGSAVATALKVSSAGDYLDGRGGDDEQTATGGEAEVVTKSGTDSVGAGGETTPSSEGAPLTSITICPKWSDVLRSPSEGGVFSPSNEMSRSSSLHGLGLTLASDRAKLLSRSGKRCASLLIDLSTYYDTFAQALLKSCQAVNNSKLSSSPVSEISNEASRSVSSIAKQLQGLAICIKGSVARPLQGSSSAMADTVPNIYNRYVLTRVKCFNARQLALKTRAKYAKAVKDAEGAIREMKKAKAVEEARDQSETADKASPREESEQAAQSSETISSPIKSPKNVWKDAVVKFGGQSLSKSSDKVIAALEEVQNLEASYRTLVEEENDAVSRSQTMEEMALEAFQKLEEERLLFLLETVERALQAEKGALDNMLMSIRKCLDDLIAMEPKIDDDLDPTRSNDQETTTLAEVKVFHLPEFLAPMRDNQKKNISRQAQRAQAIKALSIFYDEIKSAAHSFASSLQNRLSMEGYNSRSNILGKNSEIISITMKKYEGTQTQKFWSSVIDSLEHFVKSAFHLSSSLHSDGQKHFGKFLQTAERDLKTAYEAEETRWKKLCDSARTSNRAEQKCEQTNTELAKAQERLDSMSDELENKARSPDSDMNSGMNKALGNMFSILPDGGEGAMSKMLKPGQRLAIIKRNHQEAAAKVEKEKQILESRKAAKKEWIENYAQAANMANEKFLSGEKEVWSAAKASFVTVIASFQLFHESRHDVVDPAATSIKDRSGDVVLDDIRECTERIEEKRKSLIARSEQEDGIGTLKNKLRPTNDDFLLKMRLEESKNVYKLLDLVSSDDNQSPLLENDSDADEEGEDANVEKETCSSPVLQKDNFPQADFPTRKLSNNELSALDNTATASLDPLRGRSRSVDALKFMHSPARPGVSSNSKELVSLAETIKTRTDKIDTGAAVPQTSPKANKVETDGLNTPKSSKIETELFLNHFWEEVKGEEEDSNPPTIIASFSCAYWPKEGEGYISPLLHGRMFVTSLTMYFIGWGDKKIILNWSDATSVTKERTMAGTVDNALKVTYDLGEGESSYFFGSFAFRENAFRILTQMIEVAKSLNDITDKKSKQSRKLPQVPPDEVIQKMEPVLSKKIKNMSIAKFYEIVWSEGNGTDADPFYGKWLLDSECHDIDVGDWDDGGGEPEGFTNEWCGQKYDRKRTVNFKFKRTTHLYIGPPIAGVTQTHHCRVEGNDKCVMAMTVETHGIPYADVFAVEARWVARRVGLRDLMIDVGIFVDFKKSSILQSKIKQGTITESKPIYMNLFDAIKDVCAANAEPLDESQEEEEEEEEGISMAEEELEAKSRFQIAVCRARELKTSVVRYILQIKETALEHPAFRQIGTAVGLFIALMILFWCVAPASVVPDDIATYPSREEMEQLTGQMNDMKNEMKEMRIVLQQILSLMQETQRDSVVPVNNEL